MASAHDAYDALLTELRELQIISSVCSVLNWDEQTQLPPKGVEYRAEQVAYLVAMHHRRYTADRMGELLSTVEASDLITDPLGDAAANVRETRRHYDQARRVPEALVKEQSRLAILAQQAWVEARKQADYAAFAPWLAKTLDLKKQEAECLGYTEHPYDALLDHYEPGATTAQITQVFGRLREPLVDLIRRIGEANRRAPVEILHRRFPRDAQEKLARDAATAIGFDFEAGRLDVSVHPFSSTLGPRDSRITTRYDENGFGDALFGVLHETGHALYNQGLPKEHYGTPRGSYVSMGIHESQSRLWENLVGRSRSFWKHLMPKARTAFPDALTGVGDDDWYRAINDVHPSFIRVEADETTYNLHIMLRFELEQAMIAGSLAVDDIPAAWNEKMREYLGLTPPDAAKGVLQDIHWSFGGIGYFPTYTLGNLYASQLFEQARIDLGDLDAQFARGEFRPLLDWLRAKVHGQGQRYRSRELVRYVTGNEPSAEPLLAHLRRKAQDVYGV
jgi:carboxypeptidase Taq